MKTIAYIPSGNSMWMDLYNIIVKAGHSIDVVISFPANNKKIKNRNPSTLVFDINRFGGGAHFLFPRGNSVPDYALLDGKEFLDMKYKAFKIMDRQDMIGRFRFVDREATFFSLFCLSWQIIKDRKIDLVIAGHAPHALFSYIFYETASIAGVDVCHFTQNTVIPSCSIASRFNGHRFSSANDGFMRDRYTEILSNYVRSHQTADVIEPDYMVQQKKSEKIDVYGKIDAIIESGEDRPVHKVILDEADPDKVTDKGFYTVRNIDYLHKHSYLAEGASEKEWIDSLDELRFYECAKSISRDPNILNSGYVFFPIHYEPEKSSNPEGGQYYDTYTAFLRLRRFIPSHIPIIAKEHYTQLSPAMGGRKSRSPYFYRAIAKLPNTHFVHPKLSAKELIKGAIVTTTQTGTAALEAACSGRKSLIMGFPWFYGCPNVFHIDEVKTFDEIKFASVRDSESIATFMSDWVRHFSIYGAMSSSDMKIGAMRYPDEPELYNDVKRTAREIYHSLQHNGFL